MNLIGQRFPSHSAFASIIRISSGAHKPIGNFSKSFKWIAVHSLICTIPKSGVRFALAYILCIPCVRNAAMCVVYGGQSSMNKLTAKCSTGFSEKTSKNSKRNDFIAFLPRLSRRHWCRTVVSHRTETSRRILDSNPSAARFYTEFMEINSKQKFFDVSTIQSRALRVIRRDTFAACREGEWFSVFVVRASPLVVNAVLA